MGAQIVHDDDIAGGQGRNQELLDIGGEGPAVDRSVDDARRGDGITSQGGEEGAGRPMPARYRGNQAKTRGNAATLPNLDARRRQADSVPVLHGDVGGLDMPGEAPGIE